MLGFRGGFQIPEQLFACLSARFATFLMQAFQKRFQSGGLPGRALLGDPQPVVVENGQLSAFPSLQCQFKGDERFGRLE